jgi:hypothetical protein
MSDLNNVHCGSGSKFLSKRSWTKEFEMADEVINKRRREFLKVSGQVLSGVAVGGSVVATLPANRARHGDQGLRSIAGDGRELDFDPAVDAGVKEIKR